MRVLDKWYVVLFAVLELVGSGLRLGPDGLIWSMSSVIGFRSFDLMFSRGLEQFNFFTSSAGIRAGPVTTAVKFRVRSGTWN